MSVNLCIDWGNTNVKAAIFVDGVMKESSVFTGDEASANISGLIAVHKPVKAILCSVSSHSDRVEELMREKVKSFLKLDNTTRLPISNAYTSSETLGADRLALVVGAYNQYPDKNTLVVSLGTCITYNFVGKNKTFRGGAISPGLQMRLHAMHEYTDRLPIVSAHGELLLLGYDTETGMRSGAVYGMIHEIDGMVKDFESKYPDFNALLTGGDAPFFAGSLKSKIFADPDLLLKGLDLILNYNVSIPR